MKKKLITKSQLLKKTASQEKQVLALKEEIVNLKKGFIPLIADINDYVPIKEILTIMPGNIFWKNKDGKILGCNNNIAEFLGFSSYKELIGKYSRDFLPPDLAEHVDKNDKEIMLSGKASYFEEIGLDSNKNPTIFFSHKTPLYDESGNIIGLYGISIDITERKKMERELKLAKEKAEALSQAKSQLLAVVNHELRTPLTSILGLINFLKQDQLNKDEKRTIIQDLENCSQYLLSLVNDILDFSQLEADKVNVNIGSVNTHGLFNEVSRILTNLAKSKGLDLLTEIDEKIPPFILSDAKILKQILVNIINNAIKFTNTGIIKVTVNLITTTFNKAKLAIHISDTGKGIPKDKLEVIFEPFKQLDDIYTRTTSRNGTGLGLAIVKKLINLLGMTITVQSEEGKGSTFSLHGEFEISSSKNHTIAHNVSSYRKRIKVLLVEDDLIVQRIHISMLTELGCEVEATTFGLDSLKMIKDHDILFVDIGLSDIAGFEVIKFIRVNYSIPIVALTGYTGEKEKKDCIEAGANEVVKKPISLENLHAILMNYLGRIVNL